MVRGKRMCQLHETRRRKWPVWHGIIGSQLDASLWVFSSRGAEQLVEGNAGDLLAVQDQG
jgi:hypothetical protein